MKYYYYQISKANGEIQLLEFLKENYRKEFSHTKINDTTGILLAEDDFFDFMDTILSLFIHDFGMSLTIVASYEESDTALFFLYKATSLCYEKCSYLCDVLLMCILHQQDVKKYLIKQFGHLDHDELLCALMYINCGMNVSRAADKLYIHRNTFTYRLNKFITSTSLDIRDFHNAMYFYYAMQLLICA